MFVQLMWEQLPNDIVKQILEHIEDIDTRLALGLKPRRIDTSKFAQLFLGMQKPKVNSLYSSVVVLGPMHQTYNPTHSIPTYTIEHYASGFVLVKSRPATTT